MRFCTVYFEEYLRMPSTSSERIPLKELQHRHQRCRQLCATLAPEALREAGGLLVFSRLNIYYLTGTLGGGVLWLPHEGSPVLLVRKGVERCRLESPLAHIVNFVRYDEVCTLCAAAGSPLTPVLAAEMSALPWDLAEKLQCSLKDQRFVSGDAVLTAARSIKSPWELNKMRLAGQRHNRAVCQMLPKVLRHGMSERDVAHASWKIFFELGHCGVNRMGNYGEDCFLGHIAMGNNGNYPSHFNGPLGLCGEHPAMPFMGNAHTLWEKHSLLMLDIGFTLEGYHTDKTQAYWSGPAASIPDAVRRAQDACLEIQQRAAEALKPGAIPSQIWEEAVQRAEALGVSEGFMGLGGNKVQFLGHGIGLVIDESPVLARRFDAPLEEGMVLAVEPKVGLPGIGMAGVENTFAVTPSGGHSLTGTDFDIICVE